MFFLSLSRSLLHRLHTTYYTTIHVLGLPAADKVNNDTGNYEKALTLLTPLTSDHRKESADRDQDDDSFLDWLTFYFTKEKEEIDEWMNERVHTIQRSAIANRQVPIIYFYPLYNTKSNGNVFDFVCTSNTFLCTKLDLLCICGNELNCFYRVDLSFFTKNIR